MIADFDLHIGNMPLKTQDEFQVQSLLLTRYPCQLISNKCSGYELCIYLILVGKNNQINTGDI